MDSTHSLRHRLGGDPDVERGIEIARDTLDDDHALLQQDKLRPRLHVENFGIGEELAQKISHRDLFGGAPLDRLTDGAHRLREFLDAMMRRHVAGFEMNGGGAIIIAGDEAVQDLGEEAALGKSETAHDAEIDGDDLTSVIDEQVSLMHVGMEEAVTHGVAEKGSEHRQTESIGVEAFRP